MWRTPVVSAALNPSLMYTSGFTSTRTLSHENPKALTGPRAAHG